MGVSIQSASEREVVVKVSAVLGWVFGVLFFVVGIVPIVIESNGERGMGGFAFGGLFMLIGLLIGLLSRYGTIRLSVDDDQVQFRLRNLAGRKREFDSPLEEIADAEIETSRSSGSNGTSTTHRVVLIKHSGERLPLTSSSSSGGHKNNRHVVQAIRALLDVADKRREWFGVPSTR